MKYYILIFLILVTFSGFSQHQVLKGKVTDSATRQPLENVTVYWKGTTTGAITSQKGLFSIHMEDHAEFLIFSMIGYKTDTIRVTDRDHFVDHLMMPDNKSIEEIRIQASLDAAYLSRKDAILTSTITTAGLQKLACCNIGESFENDPSVDVGFSDALSGAKQIQLLGLSGIYSQIMIENIPAIRGLATPYGLSLIPGTWMESIQISKGTASVINGFESITGQINVELRKPDRSDFVLFNVYENSHLRSEANLVFAPNTGEKWYTSVLAHGGYNTYIEDHNHDGFADNPQSKTLNLMNRWKYDSHPVVAQAGIAVFGEQRTGGQTNFIEKNNVAPSYGIQVNNYQVSSFAKTAFELHDLSETSVGIQLHQLFYQLESGFGTRRFNARQNTLYANAIFQTILGNTNRQLSAGLSYRYDRVDDLLADTSQMNERMPGIFLQTTFILTPSVTVMTGLRVDYSENPGTVYTPRLHLKWGLDSTNVLRISLGKGYHFANIIPENLNLLATSRQIKIIDKPWLEEAWNAGVNFTSHFKFGHHQKLTTTIDYYHTWFQNQVIVDLYQHPQQAVIYNLDGKSFSDNLQGQMIYQPSENIEFNLAGRLSMVKATYNGVLREKPLTGKYKGLITTTYYTAWKKWKFDFTAQYNGKSRLPNTASNPQPYRLDDESPAYWMIFSQVTRNFKHFEIYAGIENLLGYVQKNPVIAADDPFGPYFDASMIWGPVSGRMFYTGFRYKIH